MHLHKPLEMGSEKGEATSADKGETGFVGDGCN